MNCKYCGAALPTKGGVCPDCGRMIPMDQQKQMREILDPRWNEYRNKDTALYKKEKFIHIYFIVLLKYCQVKRIKSYRFSLQNN